MKLTMAEFKNMHLFNYRGDKGIGGYMSEGELKVLYNLAKRMDSIVEVGSWKGRSTNALLEGSRGRGKVMAVDTFLGSNDIFDATFNKGGPQNVYEIFLENTKQFTNLEVLKMTSKDAAQNLSNQKFDMIFIDANHTYESVREDIQLWKDKANVLLCGHDYSLLWPGVVAAVYMEIGYVDFVMETIWGKFI